MLVRYHWGLGIGHAYSHEDSKSQRTSTGPDCEAELHDEDGGPQIVALDRDMRSLDSENGNDDDDPELGMSVRDDDAFSEQSNSGSESFEDPDGEDEEGDSDEEFLELVDSYYTDY